MSTIPGRSDYTCITSFRFLHVRFGDPTVRRNIKHSHGIKVTFSNVFLLFLIYRGARHPHTNSV